MQYKNIKVQALKLYVNIFRKEQPCLRTSVQDCMRAGIKAEILSNPGTIRNLTCLPTVQPFLFIELSQKGFVSPDHPLSRSHTRSISSS